MKTIILVFTFLLFIILFSQEYTLGWTQSLNDYSGGDSYCDIAIDNSNNVYVAGDYYSNDYNFVFVKYDSSGNMLRIDTLNICSYDYQPHIDVDNNYNMYICGQPSNAWDYGYFYLVIKYDSSGNILWVDSTSNGGGHDHAHDIKSDVNGNVYVTGQSSIPSASYGYYCFTVKYDSLGNVLWSDTFGINGADEKGVGQGIAVDSTGNAYVCGYSAISIGNNYIWFIIKYDDIGNIQWIDTLSFDSSYACIYDIDYHNNYIYTTGLFNPSSDNNYYCITSQLDTNGNIIHSETLNFGNNYFYPKAIISDNNKNIYITGNYQSYFYTFVYDSLWNIIWGDSLSISGDAQDITVDNANNIYVTGSSNSNYLTVKYTKTNGAVKDLNVFNTKIKLHCSDIYFNDINFSYELNEDINYILILTDINGRIIKKYTGNKRGNYNIKISDIKQGVYFIKYIQNNNELNKKIILMK